MVEKIMDGFCKEILKSLNNSALGVILIDPLGKIIWVNKTACDYSGLPRKKLIGDFAQKLNLFEKSSTEDIAKNLSLGELKNKESFNESQKINIFDRNGKKKVLECSICPLHLKNSFEGYLIFAKDISLEENLKKQLEENEKTLKLVFDNSNDLIASVDPNMKFTFMNKKWKDTFEIKDEELKKTRLKDILPKQNLKEHLKAIVALHRGKPFRLTFKVKEKIFDGTINPVFENGKIVSTVGCFRDITLEKTAEELLKESEKNYKTLIENISDAFFIITTDYKFKYINENGARLLGSTAEKIIGERVYHILARDDVNISYPELKEVVNKGIFLNREGYAKLKGRKVWLNTRLWPIKDGSGKVLFVVGTARDFTEIKIAQEELNISLEKWKNTFDSITDPISIHDKHYNILEVNKAFLKKLGVKYEDVIGKKCYEIIHKLHAPFKECPFKKTLASKKTSKAEFFEPNLNKYIDVTTSPILDGKEIKGFIHIIRDVTERKKADELLKESEKKFKTIFENSAVAITLVDKEGKLLSWNSFFENISGMTKNDLNGFNIKNLYPSREWQRLREAKISKLGMRHHFETKMYRKDKSVIDIDISLSVLKDEKGEVISSIGVIRDITNRKKNEERIRDSEKKLTDLIDLITDSVWEVDPNLVFTYVDPKIKKVTGHDSKEVIGKTIADFMKKEEAAKTMSLLRGVVMMQKPFYALEIPTLHKKGSKMILKVSGIPVFENDKFIGFRGIVKDITKRKKELEKLANFNKELEEKVRERTEDLESANRELMEIDNMKDNFISNISHELRTPLTSIKSYTQLINDGLIGPVTEDQKEGLATILKSTDRLIGLINNLLDIAKYQSGKMKLERSNCNINDIINNVIKEFLPQIKEVNGRIKFSPSKSIILNLDEEKIERVFRNIIDNSLKYKSRMDLRISISTYLKNGFLNIRIKDNGIGISKENQKHLFTKFYQVDPKINRYVEGAGIGLSLVKSIIEQHNGTINVNSELGKGIEFKISLPLKLSSKSY